MLEQQASITDEAAGQFAAPSEMHAIDIWRTKFNAWMADNRDPNIIARELCQKVKANLSYRSKQALKKGKPDEERILWGLSEQVNEDEVKAWVLGREVPRDVFMRAALLDVAGLEINFMTRTFTDDEMALIPEFDDLSKTKTRNKIQELGLDVKYVEKLLDDWRRVDAPSKRRAEKRAELLALCEVASAERHKTPICTVHCNGAHRVNNAGRHSIDSHNDDSKIHDLPYLPERIITSKYKGNLKTYEEISPAELQYIVDNTTNVAEYLRAWRILQPSCSEHRAHMGSSTAAEALGFGMNLAYYEMERGSNLPSAHAIENAHKLFKGKDCDRFIELALRNRLDGIRYYLHQTDAQVYQPSSATGLMMTMPRAYWSEMLHRTNHDRPEGTKVPAWAIAVPDITNQGEYLRATRYVLGNLSQEKVADDLIDRCKLDMSRRQVAKLIQRIEHDHTDERLSPEEKAKRDTIRDGLCAFYKEYQAENFRTEWFNQDVFDNDLPRGTMKLNIRSQHLWTSRQAEGGEGHDGQGKPGGGRRAA
jgi:hypothetical protein